METKYPLLRLAVVPAPEERLKVAQAQAYTKQFPWEPNVSALSTGASFKRRDSMVVSGAGCGSFRPAPSSPRHIFRTSFGLLALITGLGGLLAHHRLGLGGSDQFHPIWPPIEPPSHNPSRIPMPHSAEQLSICSFTGCESGRPSEGHVPASLPATSGLGPICAPPLPEREPPIQAVNPWSPIVLGEVTACSTPSHLCGPLPDFYLLLS